MAQRPETPSQFLAEFLALAKQIARVALAADTGRFGPLDRAILADQHGGAIGDALVIEHEPVRRGDGSLRIEVGQQRIGDAVKRRRPCLVAELTVYADTQDLGITGLELLFERFESRDFNASCRGEIQWIKHEKDILGTVEA